jgi:hypothetical protein
VAVNKVYRPLAPESMFPGLICFITSFAHTRQTCVVPFDWRAVPSDLRPAFERDLHAPDLFPVCQFALPDHLIRELETKLGRGIGAIYTSAVRTEFHLLDIQEVRRRH